VTSLSNENDANAIVRAVATMAKSLDMTTTAEGVETRQQREIVTEMGCTEMQGFLLSEARSCKDIAKFFTSDAVAKMVAR
jgi:EAL domain-containing protein (putative c-di-GMP-specific phosphodiesterase class I)